MPGGTVRARLRRVRTRRFGDTDLEASEIGFGTWALGSSWWGDVSEADGERLLGEALELGITFFDTGDAYGRGANEELVGRVLGPHRDEVRIATKFGYELARAAVSTPRASARSAGTRPFVREALEASLRRLGTDRVDLYQLHNPRMDGDRVRRDVRGARGAARPRASCATTASPSGPRSDGARRGCARSRTREIASVQTVYNLLEQDPGAS